jgi:hypothetical protein
MVDTPDTYSGKDGLYLRVAATEDGLEYFDLKTAILAVFNFAAYGGLSLSAPASGASVGVAWSTVEFDSLSVATPRGISANVGNNTLNVENDGVYRMTISLSFTHNEVNAGREFQVRLFDVTDSVAVGNPFRGYTGRNSPGSNFNVSSLAEITDANKGHDYRVEISSADSYTIDEWDMSEWCFNAVSEWREPFAE